MTTGPVKRGKSAEALFNRRAKKANEKIEPIPRASSEARAVPIPRARKSARELFKAYHENLRKSKAPDWKKARSRKMYRRDI